MNKTILYLRWQFFLVTALIALLSGCLTVPVHQQPIANQHHQAAQPIVKPRIIGFTKGWLNFRRKPSTKSKIIKTLKKNHMVIVLSEQRGWLHVETELTGRKVKGWLGKKYVTLQTEQVAERSFTPVAKQKPPRDDVQIEQESTNETITAQQPQAPLPQMSNLFSFGGFSNAYKAYHQAQMEQFEKAKQYRQANPNYANRYQMQRVDNNSHPFAQFASGFSNSTQQAQDMNYSSVEAAPMSNPVQVMLPTFLYDSPQLDAKQIAELRPQQNLKGVNQKGHWLEVTGYVQGKEQRGWVQRGHVRIGMMSLSGYLKPINKKLSAVQDKIDSLYSQDGWEKLVSQHPDVFKGIKPEVKGRTGVVFYCYSPGGVVDAESCETGKERSGKDILKVISIAPLIEAGGVLVPFVVRDTFVEIVTVDTNQVDVLKQVYFFGEPRFDMVYLTELGMAILNAQAQLFTGNIRVIADVPESVIFVTTFLRLLFDLGEGGVEILNRATEALKPNG